jgi:hypothetical protein
MLRLSASFLVLIGAMATSSAQAPTAPSILSTGIELCLHNGHSNEQYRNKLTQLGATPVAKEQRLLSEDPNSREEWRFTLNGTSFLTAYDFPNTFCGVLGPGEKQSVVAALKGPMKFTYHHMNSGSQEAYKGQIDGVPTSIMVSSYHSGEVYLVFVDDKMWDEFEARARTK